MSLPKYHELMLPLLAKYGDKQEHYRKEFVDPLAEEMSLDPVELRQTTRGGGNRFAGRVHWAQTFLSNSGLIESTRRGHYRITGRGLEVLGLGLPKLTNQKILEMYPSLLQTPFWNKELRDGKSANKETHEEENTPADSLDNSLDQLRADTVSQLVEAIESTTPKQFEALVVQLLEAMDYGTGVVTPYTNDGGIDGIIHGDELGLEKIFIQAKKYQGNVGRPEIQKFVGSMESTSKGVFITTSDFAPSVEAYLHSRQENIVLINGQKLAELMYDFNQGVSISRVVKLKSLDNDFFEEL